MTIGWVTLDVGQQALVYKQNGEARVEEGPKRLFLFFEKFMPLRMHTADQNSYLMIKHKNGEISHKPGPCVMFQNPLEHANVQKLPAVSLDANEILVVYRMNSKTNEVTRYLKHGPTLYIPDANEWLHEFSWHGTDPENKTRKVPGLLKFTKLKVIPEQFYYNVDEVRTADDAVMRVKLMLFYEFRNVEQMLNSTSDPIADFINCVTADVMLFAAKLTYMEFIQRAEELNNLSSYPQLVDRCKAIGADVSKVVFRGYFASPNLQKMHDNAIEARTQLKMQFEEEVQIQEMIDTKLQNEKNRVHDEQEIELQALKHKQEIERLENEHKMLLWKQDEMEKIQRKKKKDELEVQHKEKEATQKLEHYEKLHSLGVDMTLYLLSENPQPQKVVRLIADQKAAVMHFHQS